jgi:hypothetical protein
MGPPNAIQFLRLFRSSRPSNCLEPPEMKPLKGNSSEGWFSGHDVTLTSRTIHDSSSPPRSYAHIPQVNQTEVGSTESPEGCFSEQVVCTMELRPLCEQVRVHQEDSIDCRRKAQTPDYMTRREACKKRIRPEACESLRCGKSPQDPSSCENALSTTGS